VVLKVIFALFVFLTLIILGLISLGIVTKHPALIALGAVFMILAGAGLMSEGIRDEGTPTFVKSGDMVILNDYNSLTTANNFTVMMIAPSYFYGGFLVALLALFSILWAVKQRREAF